LDIYSDNNKSSDTDSSINTNGTEEKEEEFKKRISSIINNSLKQELDIPEHKIDTDWIPPPSNGFNGEDRIIPTYYFTNNKIPIINTIEIIKDDIRNMRYVRIIFIEYLRTRSSKVEIIEILELYNETFKILLRNLECVRIDYIQTKSPTNKILNFFFNNKKNTINNIINDIKNFKPLGQSIINFIKQQDINIIMEIIEIFNEVIKKLSNLL
jgi:hypothetical protein